MIKTTLYVILYFSLCFLLPISNFQVNGLIDLPSLGDTDDIIEGTIGDIGDLLSPSNSDAFVNIFQQENLVTFNATYKEVIFRLQDGGAFSILGDNNAIVDSFIVFESPLSEAIISSTTELFNTTIINYNTSNIVPNALTIAQNSTNSQVLIDQLTVGPGFETALQVISSQGSLNISNSDFSQVKRGLVFQDSNILENEGDSEGNEEGYNDSGEERSGSVSLSLNGNIIDSEREGVLVNLNSSTSLSLLQIDENNITSQSSSSIFINIENSGGETNQLTMMLQNNMLSNGFNSSADNIASIKASNVSIIGNNLNVLTAKGGIFFEGDGVIQDNDILVSEGYNSTVAIDVISKVVNSGEEDNEDSLLPIILENNIILGSFEIGMNILAPNSRISLNQIFDSSIGIQLSNSSKSEVLNNYLYSKTSNAVGIIIDSNECTVGQNNVRATSGIQASCQLSNIIDNQIEFNENGDFGTAIFENEGVNNTEQEEDSSFKTLISDNNINGPFNISIDSQSSHEVNITNNVIFSAQNGIQIFSEYCQAMNNVISAFETGIKSNRGISRVELNTIDMSSTGIGVLVDTTMNNHILEQFSISSNNIYWANTGAIIEPNTGFIFENNTISDVFQGLKADIADDPIIRLNSFFNVRYRGIEANFKDSLSSLDLFENTIECTPDTNDTMAAKFRGGGNRLNLEDTRVLQCAFGISIRDLTQVIFSNNIMSYLRGIGIESLTSNLELIGNCFTDVKTAINIDGDGFSIDGSHNWFGHSTGPSMASPSESLIGGLGSQVFINDFNANLRSLYTNFTRNEFLKSDDSKEIDNDCLPELFEVLELNSPTVLIKEINGDTVSINSQYSSGKLNILKRELDSLAWNEASMNKNSDETIEFSLDQSEFNGKQFVVEITSNLEPFLKGYSSIIETHSLSFDLAKFSTFALPCRENSIIKGMLSLDGQSVTTLDNIERFGNLVDLNLQWNIPQILNSTKFLESASNSTKIEIPCQFLQEQFQNNNNDKIDVEFEMSTKFGESISSTTIYNLNSISIKNVRVAPPLSGKAYTENFQLLFDVYPVDLRNYLEYSIFYRQNLEDVNIDPVLIKLTDNEDQFQMPFIPGQSNNITIFVVFENMPENNQRLYQSENTIDVTFPCEDENDNECISNIREDLRRLIGSQASRDQIVRSYLAQISLEDYIGDAQQRLSVRKEAASRLAQRTLNSTSLDINSTIRLFSLMRSLCQEEFLYQDNELFNLASLNLETLANEASQSYQQQINDILSKLNGNDLSDLFELGISSVSEFVSRDLLDEIISGRILNTAQVLSWLRTAYSNSGDIISYSPQSDLKFSGIKFSNSTSTQPAASLNLQTSDETHSVEFPSKFDLSIDSDSSQGSDLHVHFTHFTRNPFGFVNSTLSEISDASELSESLSISDSLKENSNSTLSLYETVVSGVSKVELLDQNENPLEVNDLDNSDPVRVKFQINETQVKAHFASVEESYFNSTRDNQNEPQQKYECRFWDTNAMEWSNEGCETIILSEVNVEIECRCTHLTEFAVTRIMWSYEYNLPSDSLSLDDITQNWAIVATMSSFIFISLGVFSLFVFWDVRDSIQLSKKSEKQFGETMGQIQNANQRNYDNFWHRLLLLLRKDHRILGLIFRRNYDPYSRSQRISVIITSLFVNIAVNSLVYDIETESIFDVREALKFIVMGVITTIVVTPVPLALGALWRTVKPSSRHIERMIRAKGQEMARADQYQRRFPWVFACTTFILLITGCAISAISVWQFYGSWWEAVVLSVAILIVGLSFIVFKVRSVNFGVSIEKNYHMLPFLPASISIWTLCSLICALCAGFSLYVGASNDLARQYPERWVLSTITSTVLNLCQLSTVIICLSLTCTASLKQGNLHSSDSDSL